MLDAADAGNNGTIMDQPIREISSREPDAWQSALDEAGPHDFYHGCAYHALAEQRGEGDARLLVWRGGADVVALPLLLRPVSRIAKLSAVAGDLTDAVSVYGYSGPVGRNMSGSARAAFTQALSAWLIQHRVVSVFFRLHPLLASWNLLTGMGEVARIGPTVAIDLRQPSEAQVAQYRSNHRRDLRKLRQQGYACRMASNPAAIATFTAIYRETMKRVDAAPDYLFDEAYFDRLLDIPGLDLMLCSIDGQDCAGAIVSRHGAIAQYHLGGTRTEWLNRAPMKLIFDEARQYAADAGCDWFHLGGGLGAREDALFNFKAGFSSHRLDFQVWRWIVDAEAYTALSQHAHASDSKAFFPAYAG